MVNAWVILLIFVPVVTIAGSFYFGYPWIEEFTEKKLEKYLQDCELLLHRMFREMPRKKMVMIIASATGVMAFFGFFITFGYGWINVLFTVAFGSLGYFSFRIFLKVLWERRLAKFNEQLVDVLNMMSNSLKAGMNLSQSLQVVVQESQNPIAQEFGLVLSQEKLGLTVDEALEKMLDRIPSEDLAITIHSVLILREKGGVLSETFDTIATTIRERRKVTGKIASLTQQGKTQGLILILLPFMLMGLLYIVNPPYILPLFTTQLGWIMIFLMLILQTVGALWVRKIVNIDV